ncbi:MAG: AAA family ATPase [Gammaproteobacteria bacterium]|nr:AAA family ATPase [Gammaproteobacteria bacterium]
MTVFRSGYSKGHDPVSGSAVPGTAETPVYIRSLDVENVRCFGEQQTLSFTDGQNNPVQWTLILGDNGVGKTTLLQCLAWMRPVRQDAEGSLIEPALSGEENSTLNSLVRVGDNQVSVNLKAVFSVGQSLGSGNRGVVSSNDTVTTGYRITGQVGNIEETTPRGHGPMSRAVPADIPVFGYGAARCTGIRRLDKGGLSDPLTSHFDDLAEFYDAEDVLLKLDYRATKSETGRKSTGGRDQERLQKIKEILISVLPDVDSPEAIHILGPEVIGHPDEPSGVRFQTPYGVVPLSALSLGYQTTLTWVLDLALRLYERYPDCSKPLSEPAIVLIDNIDLHLHPRWQRRLMDDLSTCFPAVQFVASTHSPLIVQAAEDANLVVLQQREGEVLITPHSGSVDEWRADQILSSDLFDVPTRSRSVEKLMKKRDDLLDEMCRSPEQEAALRSLENQLEELPTAVDPADQEAMDLIRCAAENLRNNG